MNRKVIRALGIVLYWLSFFAGAETIATGNEAHAVIQESIDYLHKQGCRWPKITRKQGFVSSTTGDKWKLRMDAAGYEIACVEIPAATTPPTSSLPRKFLITWTTPVTKANGTALAASDIVGYNLYLDEKFFATVAAVNSYTLTINDNAAHIVQLSTLAKYPGTDTSLESALSTTLPL